MSRILLWLDDKRNPFLDLENKVPSDDEYIIHWVLNYEQFVQWILAYGLPNTISFDHDLADEHYTPAYFWDNYEENRKFQEWRAQFYVEKTGYNCAEWLVKYCLENNKKLPKIHIHSANVVGVDKIKEVIDKVSFNI